MAEDQQLPSAGRRGRRRATTLLGVVSDLFPGSEDRIRANIQPTGSVWRPLIVVVLLTAVLGAVCLVLPDNRAAKPGASQTAPSSDPAPAANR